MKSIYIENTIRKELELWGYLEIRIPIVSENLWGNENLLFFEKNGKLLSLRPEMTSEILRNIKKENFPIRLFYMGPIFRLNGYSIEEKFQIGWELIYLPSLWRDLEILLTIRNIFAKIGIENYIIEINNTNIWNFLRKYIKEEELKNLKSLLLIKDYVSLMEYVEKLPISVNVLDDIRKLLFFEDNYSFYDDDLNEEVKSIKSFKRELVNLGYSPESILINPVFIRPFEYYDGLIFEVYLEDMKQALGGGGSYVATNKNGEKIFGTGFAFVEEDLLKNINNNNQKINKKYYICSEKDFYKIQKLIEEERKRGNIAIFIPKEMEGLDLKELEKDGEVILIENL
jgi:ATP phosphoribosyltransferase regulatory subunit